ncbi:MAG: ABC transporter permease [Candidatus Thermoplasmatota archaeon]
MDSFELQAIYIMWQRQIIRFFRSKSRVISALARPLFFLVILGSGLRPLNMPGLEGDYFTFLAPGIIVMSIIFSSMFIGISVLWDRQFGFLQEVLVAPVSRFSILFGRTLGGATLSLFQGLIILGIAIVLNLQINSNIFGFLLSFVFMGLTAFTAVGFGLVLATKMEDFQGFQIIMTLIIMPLIFLSSAFFPLSSLPSVVNKASRLNPFFYLVDGLRGSLTGGNAILNPMINLVVSAVICIVILGIGSYLFNKSEL